MNTQEIEIETHKPKEDGEFIFCHENTWILKISTKNGITFNREEYPNIDPDGFAQAFCDILEKCYDVKFEKRQ